MTGNLTPGPAGPLDWQGEEGTLIPWMLVLTAALLGLGGLGTDLYRAYSDYRATAGIVDAAAVAGATAIDQAHYRTTRTARLDPTEAAARAAGSLAAHSETVQDLAIAVAPDGAAITVAASRTVPTTLLRLLTLLDPSSLGRINELTVTARATVTPQTGVAR